MYPHVARLGAAGLAAAFLAPPVLAQQVATLSNHGTPPSHTELSQLKDELAQQRALVNRLLLEVQAQHEQLQRLGTATDGMLLSQQRGMGGSMSGQAPVAEPPVLPPAVTGVPARRSGR